MIKTEGYYLAEDTEVIVGETYYFGQLCDGNANAKELLESGAIAMYDEDGEDFVVYFDVVQYEDGENILQSIVKVTDIY